MGRESRGVKIEGRVNRGLDLMMVVDLGVCCFLMLRPKRVKVGSSVVGGGNGDAMDAADRHDGDDDDFVDLLLNEPNCCCLLAILDFTNGGGAIKASADERR